MPWRPTQANSQPTSTHRHTPMIRNGSTNTVSSATCEHKHGNLETHNVSSPTCEHKHGSWRQTPSAAPPANTNTAAWRQTPSAAPPTNTVARDKHRQQPHLQTQTWQVQTNAVSGSTCEHKHGSHKHTCKHKHSNLETNTISSATCKQKHDG